MARHSIADGVDMLRAQRNASAKAAIRRGRRGTNPATSDVQYSPEELEVLRALDAHRQTTGKPFLTAIDTLRVILSLGYRRP